ncbi:MAG: hypothetical protein GQ565_12165 [Candidatus Aegiribacteria sp.]|nr:hypothetical protein [Candidatus Aegiribacteria sp.]
MKIVVACLLVLSLSAFAEIKRSDGVGGNPSATYRGTITFVNSFPVGLTTSYGLAIQDNLADRIWISNYGTMKNLQFDMTTGNQTGVEWDITDAIDADDQAFCEYTAGNQFFFGDWVSSGIGVFSETGTFIRKIDGPASPWVLVTGVAAGNGMIYCSNFKTEANQIAWGAYTGTETSVTWTTAPIESVSGMAVYGNYLIICCQILGADNIFIYELNSDGSVNTTPVWSADFTLESMDGAGGIDFDGTYLWLYPQNTALYQLTIDFNFLALEATTWSQIKTSF